MKEVDCEPQLSFNLSFPIVNTSEAVDSALPYSNVVSLAEARDVQFRLIVRERLAKHKIFALDPLKTS